VDLLVQAGILVVFFGCEFPDDLPQPDAALPHPYFDESSADRFLKTSGHRRELKVSMAFAVRNRKKPRQHCSFRTAPRRRGARREPKALTQFTELQFDDTAECRELRPTGTGANKTRRNGFVLDSKPKIYVTNKPFIAHEFFCPL
jgi:hypothetical protein